MSSPLSAVSMGYKRSKYMNYISYLFDNGNRLLCDPKYAVEGTLNAEAMDSTHKEHFRNMVGNRMMQ